MHIINLKQVIANFPKRPRDSHKGLFGTVAVIGGASGMIGAPLLVARAALKLGAGCVHVGLLAENAPGVDLLQPELMLHKAADLLRHPPTHPLDETTSHSTRLKKTAAKSLVNPNLPEPIPILTFPLKGKGRSLFPPQGGSWKGGGEGEGANARNMFNPDVFAVGCGLGRDKAAQKLLHDALYSNAALVLDADALNILALRPDLHTLLLARNNATVLTPHPGEAARLLGCGIDEVQADRVEAVRELAQKFACSVVLKGADSLCATRDGKLFVNKTGNPGMSSPGMGDVLTGMIAAFIAQGMPADAALLLAVHLHGAAGDALAGQGISVGMTASDVAEWARWLLNKWVSRS